jgi:ABC-type oligopeptide transport system ATPase subunit
MMMVKCDNVKKYFPVKGSAMRPADGMVKALDGVSLKIENGESFGLVGESGCGKTTLGKVILGILRPDSGRVRVETGRKQAVFQDPYNSLDPKMRIRDIISEGLILKGGRADMGVRILKALDLVNLPAWVLNKYPHQFSGGEKQRIAIARAVITEPELIVCDEPVSNLDVKIQLEILKLLKEIQKRLSVTYLFISHDLRVVRFVADRIAVMREGRIIEEGMREEVYSHPRHPYTKKLLSSVITAAFAGLPHRS